MNHLTQNQKEDHVSEKNPAESTANHMHLVQTDYGSEGHGDIAVCPTEEAAEALATQLRAMRPNAQIFVEAVPLVIHPDDARIEILTIHQDVRSDGSLGDYQETRRTAWTFDAGETPAPVSLETTKKQITVFGTDHVEVRKLFTETAAGYSQS